MGNNNNSKKQMGGCMHRQDGLSPSKQKSNKVEAPEKPIGSEKKSTQTNSQKDPNDKNAEVTKKLNIQNKKTSNQKHNNYVRSIDELRKVDPKQKDKEPIVQKQQLAPFKVSQEKVSYPKVQKKVNNMDLFAMNFGQANPTISQTNNAYVGDNKTEKMIRKINIYTGNKDHPQVLQKFKENVGKYALWQCSKICEGCYSNGLVKCTLNEKNQKQCECKGYGVTLGSSDPTFYCEICWLALGNKLVLCGKCDGKGKTMK